MKNKNNVCKRCSHLWIQRNEKIFVCPKCKSPRWDEDEGLIRVDKNINPNKLLDIMLSNEIYKEDLMIIGGIVHG